MEEIVAALAAQQSELATMLAGLDDGGWPRPSRCGGWSVADVVLHLAQTNELASDYVRQPADMQFVLDRLLHGRYASHIGLGGLSLGGGTVWTLIKNSCCRERRVDAAIVMGGLQLGFAGGQFGPNRVPLLVFHADGDPRSRTRRRATPARVPPHRSGS